jgi:hypothetical protein
MLHTMISLKKRDGHQPQTKIQKRISKLPSAELVTWAENALFVIGKEITGWQRSGDKELLMDSELGAEALLEIVKELKRR